VLQLLEAIGRSGAGDLRVALDLAAAVLRAAGRPEWNDLAATAATLPNTNPMVTGRADLAGAGDGSGRVLPLAEATRLARRGVGEVASAGGGGGSTAPGEPPAASPSAAQVAAAQVPAAEVSGDGADLTG